MIKKIPPERWEEYKDLRLEALRLDPSAFSSSHEEESAFSEKEWKDRMNNVLFALVDGKPVGMIAYLFLKKKKISHVATMVSFYVKKEYRGKGLGEKLLEEAISKIENNEKIVKINLNVNPEQEAALRLYEKFGFERVGVLKKDLFVDGKYYDEMMMEKHLQRNL